MLLNFMWYYVKHAPQGSEISFYIELDGEDNFRRVMDHIDFTAFPDKEVHIEKLPLRITSADDSPLLVKLFRLFPKFFRHPLFFRKLGIRTIVILGGDDISEYYKRWMILSDLYRIRRYTNSFNTILAGQTIGPFSGYRGKLAGWCLRKAIHYTRDPLTRDYLVNTLHVPEERVHEAADLCFPDLPFQEEGKNDLANYHLSPNHYITLVPGGFISLYTNDAKQYIRAWTFFLRQLLKDENFTRYKLLLLPHVTRPEDDRKMIREIMDELAPGVTKGRVIAIEEELYPQVLRQILGMGFCTISSRMHAALSTFQMRKPAIALGYSVKYSGVVGASLQLPALVVNCTARLLSQPEEFASEVMSRLRLVASGYTELKKRLDKRIPQLQKLAEEELAGIVSISGK